MTGLETGKSRYSWQCGKENALRSCLKPRSASLFLRLCLGSSNAELSALVVFKLHTLCDLYAEICETFLPRPFAPYKI